MAGKPQNLNAFLFLQKILLTKTWSKIYLQRKASNSHGFQPQFNKYPFLANGLETHSDKALMFHTEGALLKSSSVFSYFFLVAFEAGGLLRAFILFLLHPIICLVGKEWGLKIMVFVCFVGLKEESFRIGRTVLPKFFLEDVGNEGFDMVMKCGGKKIGVTDMPRVMVDCFLKDYLRVEAVVGRELKVVCGHFVGLMEEKKPSSTAFLELDELLGKENMDSSVIGISCFNNSLDQQLFSCCEVLYMVSEADKKNWQALPREKYPRPLIFHDGRLAFRPTPLASLRMFMWIPFGIFLLIVRATVGCLIPYKFSTPFLCFTGLTGTLIRPSSFPDRADDEQKQGGVLYVCNHRTLLDPIYVSIGLDKPFNAVTYSLSRMTELLAPIKTVRLTRNREEDSKMIGKLLKQGDLVICPEGTTCREPYLLRFSPLFAEITDEIVPVAIDFQVSMFYGTTASGFKFLDPFFLLMNPTSHCSASILEKLPKSLTCQGGGKSKFEVANRVQAIIAKALNFECTSLTRRDKYMILAGNQGIV
ncbi:PREDICTED: probable glycerol-3-phosphate acyltransferase 3 [Theobroma cacao]|uniref:Probable glycerol-3-phosphate acyltransferase 3 n=1 Tax=Theobroma cacao TaxID=3641 RepID=A0AB32V6Q7_THECC|nr:PREDICTED: probable glycerol-3-phosphate acyltransferase 3 [Theobroma cacao]